MTDNTTTTTGVARCRGRIAYLATLPAGWHDGEGLAMTEAAITVAMKLLDARPSLARGWFIFPADDGGLVFECAVAGSDCAIDVTPSGRLEVYGADELAPSTFATISPQFLNALDGLTGDAP